LKALLPIVIMLTACAAQGGDEGGGARLPNRGIAGWIVSGSIDEPFVIESGAGDAALFGGPSALVVEGEIVVWFHALGAGAPVVRRAASPDGEAFGPATDALAEARDPSVVCADDGAFWMAFADPEGGLGLARSDDGRTFERVTASGLPAGTEPSLVIDDRRFVLYAVVDGAIVRAEAGADRAFGEATVVLAPGTDCADAFGVAEPCWDATALGGPDVRLARTATGRRVLRMMYAGRRGATSDLGFAASFDGLTWSRYAYNPVVEQGFSQESPSAIALPDGYALYWSEPRSASFGGVVLARSAPTVPAERW